MPSRCRLEQDATNEVHGCVDCGSDVTKCTECRAGFVIDVQTGIYTGRCITKATCLFLDDGTDCRVCANGAASGWFKGCAECSSEDACSKCKTGFKFVTATGTCEECAPHKASLGGTTTTCTDCAALVKVPNADRSGCVGCDAGTKPNADGSACIKDTCMPDSGKNTVAGYTDCEAAAPATCTTCRADTLLNTA